MKNTPSAMRLLESIRSLLYILGIFGGVLAFVKQEWTMFGPSVAIGLGIESTNKNRLSILKPYK
ncbi:hypothetical protein [Halalkalibacillus halophilus]|uniref:hypothetical protein n=1 Tax=Halalkalibacillus halophilus TaxID=392827 RepID=UPI0003F54703|nr:hypothetical protein [Halalkalibacillus halophilus]